MTPRRTALGLLTSLTLLGGVLASPASAAPSTTVTLRVVDGSGQPIEGVSVLAINADLLEDLDEDDYDEFDDEDSFEGFVQFGDTNSDGNIVKSRGNYPANQLTEGTWSFLFSDSDTARRKAGTSYASHVEDKQIVAGTENAFGDVALKEGSSIAGVAKAPSGKVLKGLDLELESNRDDDLDYDYDSTSSTGRFVFSGLVPDTYRIRAYVDAYRELDEDVDTKVVVAITGHGQHKTANVSNLKVRCESGLYVSSPAKGTTRILLDANATEYGISKPGGTMKLYRDGKLIRDFPWSGPEKVITLKNQTKGKKVTYKAVHTGGDCLKWSSTKKVTVKKK